MSDRQIDASPVRAISKRGRWGVALCSALALASPAATQVVPDALAPSGGPVVPPSALAPATGAETVADPLRVYGDDSPAFPGFGLLGALGVHVVANAGIEYNDNLARLGTRAVGPGARYQSRSDWIFRPSLLLSAGHAVGRQQLFVAGSVGRDIYARNALLNRNRMAVNGGMNWALGVRCNGQFSGGYSRRGTQFGMFEDVIPSTQERWNLQAGGTCRTATGITANANYNRFWVYNDTDDPLGLVDRSWANVEGQGAGLGLGYPVGNRGMVGVRGNWRRQSFPNQFLPTGGYNGSTIWGSEAYASYRFGPFLRLDGGLGKSWVNPDNPFTPDFSGLSWNLGLSYTGSRLGVSASTGRNVNGSSGGLYNYSIGNFENVTATYRASERLSLSTGATFSDLDYHGSTLLPDSELIRGTRNERYFVGADYRLNRILSFSLDFNHHRRRSTPDLYNYRVNTVVFNARASF